MSFYPHIIWKLQLLNLWLPFAECLIQSLLVLGVARYTHTRLTALFPGLPGWAGTRKVKPIWILLKQETVSGGGISWSYASLHFAPDRITTPAPHHSVFYRPNAISAAQPTASKHWRHSQKIRRSAKCKITVTGNMSAKPAEIDAQADRTRQNARDRSKA